MHRQCKPKGKQVQAKLGLQAINRIGSKKGNYIPKREQGKKKKRGGSPCIAK